MPKIHLLIGPVGAGKSTFALELAREHRGVRLTLDEWMQSLERRAHVTVAAPRTFASVRALDG